MDANPKTRARTLLTLLWRKYDTGGISMGRSYEAVLLEAAMDLLGPPDTDDVRRLETMDAGELLNETRSYLSAERARREGLTSNALAQADAACGVSPGAECYAEADGGKDE